MATRGVRVGQDAMIRLLAALAAMGLACTQAVAGTVHRRGTPPSVVETDAATWLALATGRLTWQDALADGALHASGERCDLSAYLPLVRIPA